MNEVEKKEINSREDCEWFGVRTPQKPCGQCNKDCQYNDNKTQKDYQAKNEIEEMAGDIAYELSNCQKYNGINDCATCDLLTKYGGCSLAETVSKELFKEGYRKVYGMVDYCSGNLEIALKEVSHLQNVIRENREQFAEQLKRVRQQAIKEFAEKLKNKFNGYEVTSYNGYEEGWHDLQEEIDDLLKEYGVEVGK